MLKIPLIALLAIMTILVVEVFFKYNKNMTLDNNKKNILFIHHSTGGNLLSQGEVRKLLIAKSDDVAFWDHGYNLYPSLLLSKILGPITFRTGLSDPKGRQTSEDFDIVISNNSPREYAEIFNREISDPTLSKILKFDTIIFKNCFPTTKIESDEQLEEIIEYYKKVKTGVERFPEKTFVVFTPPPVRAEVTKPESAKRARKLADWMNSTEFISTSSNLKVFDFYSLLADLKGENANMLRRDYVPLIYLDSHPNRKANQQIAPMFVEFINNLLL